jgi:FAT domain
MVTVQELSELEEVVQHKAALAALSIDSKYTTGTTTTSTTISSAASSEEAARLRTLRAKWSARLQWVPEDTDVWRRILSVRSLVFAPKQVSASHVFYADTLHVLNAILSYRSLQCCV